MNLHIHHSDLIAKIRRHGRNLVATQQVVRRLRRLISTLPCPPRQEGAEPGRRQARQFLQPSYPKLVDEYISVERDRLEAKVQYDTHMMLLKARQSLRALQRHR